MSGHLEVSALGCRRGGRRVFKDLSFGLGAGDLLALRGPNGSGKTTLLRALALLVPADQGSIRWRGDDVALDRDAWHRRLAWLGHLDGLKADLTVEENLSAAQHLAGRPVDSSNMGTALDIFDLVALAARPVRTLSAGQRRRAALARVAGSGAELWLLDEPLNALDTPAQAALRAALAKHLAAGGLAIAATHASLGLDGARELELGR